jgi:hypothetical protein
MRLIRRLTSASPLTISLLLATATVLLPSTVLATNGAGRLSEEEAVRAARELARWLAVDCEDGNLMRVTRYKQAIVADLIGALEKGAASDQLELVRREAEASYVELKRHRWEVASTMDVYVKRDVDNFAAQYRARAAQALAAIGGPDARAALEAILAKAGKGEVQIREDVRRAIELFLSKAK